MAGDCERETGWGRGVLWPETTPTIEVSQKMTIPGQTAFLSSRPVYFLPPGLFWALQTPPVGPTPHRAFTMPVNGFRFHAGFQVRALCVTGVLALTFVTHTSQLALRPGQPAHLLYILTLLPHHVSLPASCPWPCPQSPQSIPTVLLSPLSRTPITSHQFLASDSSAVCPALSHPIAPDDQGSSEPGCYCTPPGMPFPGQYPWLSEGQTCNPFQMEIGAKTNPGEVFILQNSILAPHLFHTYYPVVSLPQLNSRHLGASTKSDSFLHLKMWVKQYKLLTMSQT